MTTASPQSKPEKLLNDFIKELAGDKELPHEEFLLSKYKNQAKILLKSGSAQPETYVVLGACYARLFQEEKARETFHQALNRFPNNFLLNINYASVLRNLSYSYQARKYAKISYDLHQGDLDALHEVICSNVGAGRLREAKKWLNQWDKEKPNDPHLLTKMINDGYRIFNENEISDDDAEQFIKVAFEPIRKRNLNMRFGIFAERDDERSWLTFDFSVKANINLIAEMNMDIAEKLSYNSDLPIVSDGSIVPLVRPAV